MGTGLPEKRNTSCEGINEKMELVDDNNKMSMGLDNSRFTPRTWFMGGFGVIGILSVVQIALSGALLGMFPDHPHGNPLGMVHDHHEGYSYETLEQTWTVDNIRPPGFEGQSWKNVIEKARGSTVTWAADQSYMGGKDANYIPFLKAQLKSKFDITLNFKDMGAKAAVEMAKKDANIDFIWLNKANYFLLKEYGLNYGPYADIVPNGANFDFTDPVLSTDFAVPTNGEEMPLHIAHFVMVYDKDNIPANVPNFPPKNIGQLFEQVNNDQIIFHPMDPATFPGAPFLEQVFYHYAGPEDVGKFREAFDPVFWKQIKDKVFVELKKFHDKLYVSQGLKYSAPPVVRQLFNEKKVHLSQEFAPGAVFNRIESGEYPSMATAYIFDEKMITNTNFLTIVGNGPNRAGALVAVNLAASLEHQYKRFIPTKGSWKGLQAFSPFKSHIKAAGWNTVFDEVEAYENAPSYEQLVDNQIGEMNQAYFDKMRADFANEIGTSEILKSV